MEQQCACGCGQTINKGRWAPGHDHRAVHARISEHGNVAEFIEWYDWAINKVGKGPRRKRRTTAQAEPVQPKLPVMDEPRQENVDGE